MGKLIGRLEISSNASESRVGFETQGGGQWPVWDRYLTLDGRRAHHIGNICDTCTFLFERMEGANDKLALAFADELRDGLKGLDPDFVEHAVSILPSGPYVAALLELRPSLVAPGGKEDYFSHEQIESWGVDSFWGLAHNPKNEYYRTQRQEIGPHATLFEFIVPMFPSSWLKPETLETYRNALNKKSRPTAFSVSILDVKQHYDSDQQHWCWAHYLLDGHHKMKAASEQNATVSLLSFIAVEKGISTKEQIGTLLSAI